MPFSRRALLGVLACTAGVGAVFKKKQSHGGAAVSFNVGMQTDPGAWVEAHAKRLSTGNLRLGGKPEDATVIVTFAGMKKTEYLDAAVMLAQSLKKHAPGYPLVALAIDGMSKPNQNLLTQAGWQLLFVENWEDEYCRDDCNQEFMKRWHDTFEKINVFRLGVGKVLFMDADTYVFSSRIQQLLTSTIEDGRIKMAPDGCKSEYNSGVMLFRPNVAIFRRMLQLVTTRSREQVLDQNIINAAYEGNITEIDRDFNCVDIMGVQPGQSKACDKTCSSDVVVAHFTGHPKPTAAKRRLLEMVRRPESPETTCKNTNFGSCHKWSEYYCDIRANEKLLSKSLRGWLKQTGQCCHTPYDPQHDAESCLRCPDSLKVTGGTEWPKEASGTFMKSSIKSTTYNGGKPIYVKSGTPNTYLYYVQKQVLWMIGEDYNNNSPYAYALVDALCPRDVQKWHMIVNGEWAWYKDVRVEADGSANETQPRLFDVQRMSWVPDEGTGATYQEDWD